MNLPFPPPVWFSATMLPAPGQTLCRHPREKVTDGGRGRCGALFRGAVSIPGHRRLDGHRQVRRQGEKDLDQAQLAVPGIAPVIQRLGAQLVRWGSSPRDVTQLERPDQARVEAAEIGGGGARAEQVQHVDHQPSSRRPRRDDQRHSVAQRASGGVRHELNGDIQGGFLSGGAHGCQPRRRAFRHRVLVHYENSAGAKGRGHFDQPGRGPDIQGRGEDDGTDVGDGYSGGLRPRAQPPLRAPVGAHRRQRRAGNSQGHPHCGEAGVRRDVHKNVGFGTSDRQRGQAQLHEKLLRDASPRPPAGVGSVKMTSDLMVTGTVVPVAVVEVAQGEAPGNEELAGDAELGAQQPGRRSR